MSARRILIGCAVVTLIALVLAITGGIIAWKRMTAHMPTTPPDLMIDESSLGFVAMRLEPGDPWFDAMIRSSPELKDADPEDLLPFSLIWIAREGRGTSITFSLQPRGRLIGSILDFTLWRAARSGEDHIARFEHEGEGVTSFPGTGFPGHLFVRGNTVVWSSDPDGARRSVDLMTGRHTPAGPTVARYAGPAEGQAIHGALARREGALARALASLPGDALDLTDEDLAEIEAIGFALDAVSADRATGEIRIHFPDPVPAERRRQITADFAARLARTPLDEVIVAASPAGDDPGAIVLSLEGIDRLDERIGRLFDRAIDLIARADRDGVLIRSDGSR